MRLFLFILFFPFATSNPIYFEGGETSRYFPKTGGYVNDIDGIENCNPVSNPDTANGLVHDWTLSRSFDTAYQGNASMRFEVRWPGSPIDSSLLVGGIKRVRSEVRIVDSDVDTRWTPDAWYSEVLYFPAGGMAQDSLSDEVLNQWFIDGGNDCVIRMRNKRVWLEVISQKYDLFKSIGTDSTTNETTAANTFTKCQFDRWYQFVFHFVHSTGSDGRLEVWRDGTKIIDFHGVTKHTSGGIRWKVGIYKADYTVHPEYLDQTVRTMFVDNIMWGDETATYEQMSGGGSGDIIISTPPAGFKTKQKYKIVHL